MWLIDVTSICHVLFVDTVRHLSETYQLALKLAFTAQRGFHVTLKTPKSTEKPDIPVNFIKISKRSGVFNMTTDKLVHMKKMFLSQHASTL